MLQLYLLKKNAPNVDVEKHLTPNLQSSWVINFSLHYSEATVHRFSSKYTFLKISQYSQKNTCVGTSLKREWKTGTFRRILRNF